MTARTMTEVMAGYYENGDSILSRLQEKVALPKINLSIRIETAENAYIIRMVDYGATDANEPATEVTKVSTSPAELGMIIIRELKRLTNG